MNENVFSCSFCKDFFENENEFLIHFKESHISKEELHVDEDISSLLNDLKSNFPECEVNIDYNSNIVILKFGKTIIHNYIDDNLIFDSINHKLETIERITSKVKDDFGIKDIFCEAFTYGYSLDEHSLSFLYRESEEQEYIERIYYLYDNKVSENQFINSFGVNSLMVISGKVTYDYGTYFVDGIAIDEFVLKAKKVRIKKENE